MLVSTQEFINTIRQIQKVSKEATDAHVWDIIHQFDHNRDGFIEADEILKVERKFPIRSNFIRIYSRHLKSSGTKKCKSQKNISKKSSISFEKNISLKKKKTSKQKSNNYPSIIPWANHPTRRSKTLSFFYLSQRKRRQESSSVFSFFYL